jgi:hypothetical protein
MCSHDVIPETLRRLRFDDVSLSYPHREPLYSTSLVNGDSDLVDLGGDKLLAALARSGKFRSRKPAFGKFCCEGILRALAR